ncbi:MAG: hypothetical protein C5B51_14000 [Terriglobia bacterium]|nr:MAG: hypothetical protein C5B51_14000 [Terriglobia bacterium]
MSDRLLTRAAPKQSRDREGAVKQPRRQHTNAGRLAALSASVFVLELAALHVYFSGGCPWWVPAGGHLAIAFALLAWCYRSRACREDVRLPLLLALSTAVLGPIGPAGTLVTIVLARWYMRNPIPFEEWYRSLFPEAVETTEDQLLKRIAGWDAEDPGGLSAFMDILSFGSLHQKQALIALMTQHFRPAFGSILKRALSDTQAAVRVQAATAINRLENAMLERTLALTGRVREDPNRAEALRNLARHYDEYLYTGILEARREEEVRDQALSAYAQALEADPSDEESVLAMGRLLLRGKRYAEAYQYIERAIKNCPSTRQTGLWHMECLFHLGRFGELREAAGRSRGNLDSFSEFPASAVEAVTLWAGAQP